MFPKAELVGRNGTHIALKSVHIDGQVDGMLSTITVTQHYRNDCGKKLEIVYTFSLARGAELLGMYVALRNRRLRAVVVDKDEAWDRYEQAIDANDTPILVERNYFDEYTINLGNIEDGEEVTAELRYAQLLRHDGRMVHLRIPCVIAARRGGSRGDGALATHVSTEPSILAEYPLSARIVLRGRNAQAEITHISHECSVNQMEGSKEIVLRSGAMLDRDFSVSFADLSENSVAIAAQDGDEHIMLAAFRPNLPSKKNPLRVKILLDCSGSMFSIGIESAKKTLWSLLGILDQEDSVSFSCFGNSIRHDIDRLQTCSYNLRMELCTFIDAAQADMGGIKVAQALTSIFHDFGVSATSEDDASNCCVLLITNGAIGDMEKIIDAGVLSRHRIFTLGVGVAPAESLLGELADRTGGACEIVSHRGDEAIKIENLVHKMRSSRATSSGIDWGTEPVWQSAPPVGLYHGETVYAFASFTTAPTRAPVLCWTVDGVSERLPLTRIEQIGGDVLPRLAGLHRIANAESREEKHNLALKYQLVREDTALLLIDIGEGDKNAAPPLIHKVPQMMAAGHDGFGIRFLCEDSKPKCFAKSAPTPRCLLGAFDKYVVNGMDCAQAVLKTLALTENSKLGSILASQGKNNDLPVIQVMMVFLYWLEGILQWNAYTVSPSTQRLLREHVISIPSQAKFRIIYLAEQIYPNVVLDSWKGEGIFSE